MASAADILGAVAWWEARPTREVPDGSNVVDGISDWYGPPLPDAWCAAFVSRVLWDTNGGAMPYGIPKFCWCSAGADYMRGQGWSVPVHDAPPASVVFFDWDGTGRNSYDHVGFLVDHIGGGLAMCGEGNTKNEVGYRNRYYSEIAEAFALPYGPASPVPTPPPPMGDRMRHFYRFGCLNLVSLGDDGIVRTCWEPHPGAALTSWQATGGPTSQPQAFVGGQLELDLDANGTARVWVSTPPFGIVWEQHQPPSGGGWSSWVQRTG